MKRTLLIILTVILLLVVILAAAWYIPMPLDPFHDFQVLYRADTGILRGIALYDREAQAEMVAGDLGVSVERVFVLPFPYPPWFALATLPLVLLPAEVAVRAWFLLNITMLLASVWLMTTDWHPRARLYSFIAAPLFFPVFGAWIVGQYVFPTILGAALLVHALQKQKALLAALGMALVTFKPHIGMFVALAVAAHLLLRRDEFGRRAFFYTVITGAILFVLGFLADPAWPINYLRSLLDFRDVPGVSSCGLCASLPVGLAALATGRTSISLAFPLGAALFIILLGALLLFRREIFRDPGSLVTASVLVTLLADPYLLNYDFALLIVPLFSLASSARRADWFWLILAYLLPLFLLGMFGRGGSLYLPLTALLLLSLQVKRAKSIDVSPRAA